jgi:hypothetical protein
MFATLDVDHCALDGSDAAKLPDRLRRRCRTPRLLGSAPVTEAQATAAEDIHVDLAGLPKDELVEWLEPMMLIHAPIVRLGGRRSIPLSPPLFEALVPSLESVPAALREIVGMTV